MKCPKCGKKEPLTSFIHVRARKAKVFHRCICSHTWYKMIYNRAKRDWENFNSPLNWWKI